MLGFSFYQIKFWEKICRKIFLYHCYVKDYTAMQRFTWKCPKMVNINTRQIALVAIFAALFFALSLAPIKIPTTVGLISISFSALIATIFGLVLGPYLGAAAALLGSTVTWALMGMSPYDLPFIIAPMFNALVSGLIFYKKWKWGFGVFAVFIVAFLFTPPVTPLTGQSTIAGVLIDNWYIAIAVLFDKIAALLLILPLTFLGKKLSFGYGAVFFFLVAFIGNQADNMYGTFVFSWPAVYNGIFGMPLEIVQLSFLASPFLYPAIRLIQAFIAMLIAVPLIKALNGTPWLWKKENILSKDQPEKANVVKTTSS